MSPSELAGVVGEYDGMLIRSAVKVTAEVLKRPGNLAAIARAGVGVDNVDLEAATAAGVLVLNTPDANTVSTAEHAVALMLALHRRIPDAHQHVAGGEWNRSEYVGEQVAGKTLGIIGFGYVQCRALREGGWTLGWMIAAVLFAVFAVGSKETGLAVIPLALVQHWLLSHRPELAERRTRTASSPSRRR